MPRPGSVASSRFGRLDVLVNNAAVSKRKHILEVGHEEAEHTVRTNLLGPIHFVLEALPMMIERRSGTSVNVSSIAGRLGNPREAIYSVTKFGLVGLSEVLFHDLHRRGIHTLLVVPGPIDTEIWEKIESPAAYRGRLHPARDVAEAIFDAIARKRHVVTFPRRLAVVPVLKALFPALVRRGADAFDPDRR